MREGGVLDSADPEHLSDALDTLGTSSGARVESITSPRDQTRFHRDVARTRRMNMRFGPDLFSSTNSNRLRGIVKGGARFFRGPPESTATIESEVQCCQTDSVYLNWIGDSFESINRHLVRMQVERLLRVMSTAESAYHVWPHPFSLAESEELRDLFYLWSVSAAQLRDEGGVEIGTMGGPWMADSVRGSDAAVFTRADWYRGLMWSWASQNVSAVAYVVDPSS